ncbi:TPA: tyrosine-type recombinase/integrase [Burkholderia vietnamiensis]|nr:tyrosine-type recombinase/integrase [Burkholderia vietnamiensis]
MRLVFATADFVYASRPRPGFPLILSDDMTPAQPFHAYLRWLLLERGKALDVKTWESYGRHIWDFASFLHANGFAWNRPFTSVGASVLRVYRDWQAQDLKLEPRFVNARLRIVQGFYRWALGRRMIERLPFTTSDVTVYGIEHDLTHETGGRRTFDKSDLELAEWDKDPVFLTAEQIRLARSNIRSTSQRLLFDLMARVGLRSLEARTFPLCAVFEPATRQHLKPDSLIEVSLDPRRMRTKFSKPRVVHVPYSLMEEMHAYSQFERNRTLDPKRESSTLLLTTQGNAYSKGAVHKAMTDLGRRLGFAIQPLMLRHSYAIHTLLLLRAHPEIKMEPLLYVRDRLGHADVKTTMVYLKQIDRLLGAEALALMEEFDRLYDVTSLLRSSPAVLPETG